MSFDQTLSIGEFQTAVTHAQQALRRELDRNDGRICILIPTNDPAFALPAIVACSELGAIAVPWRPDVQPRETIARTVRATHMIDPARAKVGVPFEPSRLPAPGDVTTWPGDLIVMTSGSTGEPKGVLLDLAKVFTNAEMAGHAIGIEECDAWAIDIDVGLMSAISHFCMAWSAGVPLVHLAGMSKERRAQEFACRNLGFGGAPLQLMRMADQLPPGVAPRLMVSSGDFFGSPNVEALQRRFPSTRIAKFYGLTELSGRFCVAAPEALRARPDGCGWPMSAFRIRLEGAEGTQPDEGELCVESALLFHGYCLAERGFVPRRSGPFGTGDLARVELDGSISLLGRQDDVFKVGGEKVDRASIERVAAPLFDGCEMIALAMPHAMLGSVPLLFVATTNAARLPSWADVVGRFRAELASRYVPVSIHVIKGSLPRTSTGKVDRQRLLRERPHYPILR